MRVTMVAADKLRKGNNFIYARGSLISDVIEGHSRFVSFKLVLMRYCQNNLHLWHLDGNLI